jgi:hypothetical protein
MFHEDNFRLRIADGSLPDYLLFAFLATALRYTTDSYYHGTQAQAAEEYAKQSWHCIVSQWCAIETAPGICIVQAITLIAELDFTGTTTSISI